MLMKSEHAERVCLLISDVRNIMYGIKRCALGISSNKEIEIINIAIQQAGDQLDELANHVMIELVRLERLKLNQNLNQNPTPKQENVTERKRGTSKNRVAS